MGSEIHGADSSLPARRSKKQIFLSVDIPPSISGAGQSALVALEMERRLREKAASGVEEESESDAEERGATDLSSPVKGVSKCGESVSL